MDTTTNLLLKEIRDNTAPNGGSSTTNVNVTGNTAGLATGTDITAVVNALADLVKETGAGSIEGLISEVRDSTEIIADNNVHRLNRIKGASNYNANIVYVGATTDVSTITHSGTTVLGNPETLLATYTYDGSNRLTGIQYS